MRKLAFASLTLFLVASLAGVAFAQDGPKADVPDGKPPVVSGAEADYVCTPDPTGQTYPWIDATQGTELTEAEGDDVIGQFAWPFDFTVYDSAYTAGVDLIDVNSNGSIHFDQGGPRTLWVNCGQIPSTIDGQFVAPLGDDLISNSVWYIVTGDPGNQVLTIEYVNTEEYGTAPGVGNLEVSFYEATGDIVMQTQIVAPFDFAGDGVVGINAGDEVYGEEVYCASGGGLPSDDFDVACSMGGAPGTIHVEAIDGFFVTDYLGRPILRSHVWVADDGGGMMADVLVDASIWVPDGGPYLRSRYTKPSGAANFHWGSWTDGTWTLCVDNLTLAGYTYEPGDNVVTCVDWFN